MPQHYFIKQDDCFRNWPVFSQLISTYCITLLVFKWAIIKKCGSVACINKCPVKKVGSLKEEL